MPKYLFLVKFTSEGLKGLRSSGAAARAQYGRDFVAAAGGTLEAYYFAFGETDLYGIADLPNDETAAAMALSFGESGVVSAQTVQLLTPEQVDAAFQINVGYSPPGR